MHWTAVLLIRAWRNYNFCKIFIDQLDMEEFLSLCQSRVWVFDWGTFLNSDWQSWGHAVVRLTVSSSPPDTSRSQGGNRKGLSGSRQIWNMITHFIVQLLREKRVRWVRHFTGGFINKYKESFQISFFSLFVEIAQTVVMDKR